MTDRTPSPEPMPISQERSLRYDVRRLELGVGAGFDDFRARFEAAVPKHDEARFAQLAADGAAWDEVLAVAAAGAPHGFMIFWGRYVTPLMSLDGSRADCASYLMGNPTIAAGMFRHHPGVMLYAPLRAVLYARVGDEQATFSIDQPSSHFASFGVPAITAVGVELDRKLAALLEFLGAPVPAVLTH